MYHLLRNKFKNYRTVYCLNVFTILRTNFSLKTYFPKVTKMVSITGHRIDHNGVGVVVLRGAGRVV